MKNLAIYSFVLDNMNEEFSTIVEDRKVTQQAQAIAAELKTAFAKKAAIQNEDLTEILDGKDYALSTMGWQDLQQDLRMAAAYKAEQLAKKVQQKKTASKFGAARAKLTRQEAMMDTWDKVAFMVEWTILDLKDTLFLDRKLSYGEVKCLLKGLASAAAREAAGSKGMNKMFYKTLIDVLWDASCVRFMMAKNNLAKDSQESKAWKKIQRVIWS